MKPRFRCARLVPVALTLALGLATTCLAADPPSDPRLSEAQRALLILGLDPGKTTGLVNPQTTHALESFQKQQGLPVTGRPDDATMAKLRDKRDNNPTQVLGNPKTGAPDRRPAAAPAIEPHPQAVGPSVAVGGNLLPDAPREFNPVAGNPAAAGARPPTPSAVAPRLEPPAPIAAAPQEPVRADRVDLPPGQTAGSLLERTLEQAQRGETWLRWIWAPIAGLLVLIGLGAWWRAGRTTNPYLAASDNPTSRRREPTLGPQER
jgi:hypothetical protein